MLENGKEMPIQNTFWNNPCRKKSENVLKSQKQTTAITKKQNPPTAHRNKERSWQLWGTQRLKTWLPSLQLHFALKLGDHIPWKFRKCLKVWWFWFGGSKIQTEADKEQAKKNSQSCETLLLKIMTEIYDCFLPQQKAAQLEGWKQQALCTSMLCFAYSITHWLGDKNKQDNTLSNPTRRRWREKLVTLILGHVCAHRLFANWGT